MTETAKLDRDTVITHSDDQVSCEVDGAAVLMSVENGEYYKLDDIGASIWSLVQAPIKVGTVCEKLTQEYEVAPSECEADVLMLLESMLKRKLIKVM